MHRLRLIKNQKTVSEVMIGRKLDDNMWHSISILRITRLLNIKLDSEAERNILIPGFATDLNLNRILYIGGIGKQHMTPEGKITTKTKLDYKKKIPFRGCLRNIIIDNKEPLVALSRRNKNLVIYGVVTRPCHASEFNPIQFPNPQSLVDLVRIPSSLVEREMDIKLKFRTFDSEGTIVFAEGKRCHFILGVQKKQIYLELKQDDVLPARVEVQGDVNDGLWHRVRATITQTAISLQVGNSAQISASLLKTTNGYQCSIPTKFLIGGGAKRKMKRGFVGCLNEINVNSRTIHAFDSREVSLKGSIKRGCKIKDKCFPSPCRNGGKCFQSWHSYGCDCSKTTFYGKHCNIPIYKATCTGYKAIGLEKDSNCILDSDGTGRLTPYTISCNVKDDGEIATVVHHSREKTVNVTDGADMIRGSFFHLVNYDLPMEKIEALIKSSVKCRQHLRFDCYNAALLNSPKGPPNAMWQTRTGDVKSYWGGVPDGGRGCKCGLTRSCLRRDKLCNCDSLNNRWVEDSGYVEDKDLLPITRMHFTGIHRGFGYVTLGPLECFGPREVDEGAERPPSEILSQVCMSVAMKNYMTANETQFVWNTPVEEDHPEEPNVFEGQEQAKEVNTVTPTTFTATINLTPNNNPTKERTRIDQGGNAGAQSTRRPVSDNFNTTMSLLQRKGKDSPFQYIDNTGEGRDLSVLEIILIAFAALAVTVLLIKFVLLKGIDFIRRRYQIKRLYLNESTRNSNGNGVDQPVKGNEQGEIRMKKGVLRKSRNNDWV
ncbi:contactin-associated protein-like 5 isoform X2 [Rhopilema esculentum]|uniref:contactin-associated protein-like 5 isoform X2 n=1 Tax=Rhopilema esculentum TaxID=499914 RepID=UPI0031DA7C15